MNGLKLDSLKVVLADISVEDKDNLIKFLLEQKDIDYENYKELLVAKTTDISLKNCLILLYLIDHDCRTNFSARLYTTGYDMISDGSFYDKASYNEIGVIANCKLVGQALLRILFYIDECKDKDDEDEIESKFKDDKNMFIECEEKEPKNVFDMIQFMASNESTFGGTDLVTSKLKSEIAYRKNGTSSTKVYENTISDVDVWTLRRIWSTIYTEDDYTKTFPRTPVREIIE